MFSPRTVRVGAAFLLLALASTGHGRTTQDLLGDLRTAMQDTSASPSDKANEGTMRQLSQSLLPDSAGNFSGSGIQEGAKLLTQISNQTHSDKVRLLCQTIIRQAQAESEQREATLTARTDDMIKRVAETIPKAKSEEVDALLQEIARLQADPGLSSTELGRRAREKLGAARRFASLWKSYLTQEANSNPEGAIQTLNQILQDTSFPFVPRSEILGRVQRLTETKAKLADTTRSVLTRVDDIYAAVKAPDDIAAALEQLRAIRQQSSREVDGSALQELERLDATWKQIRAGMNVQIGLPLENSRFTDLRLRMFMLALPRWLGVPADLRPGADETPGDYLNRVAAAAKKGGDYPLLLKTMDAPRALLSSSSGFGSLKSNTVASALRAFIVAQNADQAGQYASAVASYQSALTDLDNVVPLPLVRDRLAAIKQEHAAEYAEGLQRALNPPVPRYPAGYPSDTRFAAPDTAGMPPTRATPPMATGTPATGRVQPTPPPGFRRSSPPPGQ